MFVRQKGLLSSIVQAGLSLAAVALVSACGEQPAPVDSAPARVAATSPSATTDNAERTDMPEIVVTASRSSESET